MKRITSWVMAVCLLLGGVSAAHADNVDVKVKGVWDFAFGWARGFNNTFHPGNQIDGNDESGFHAKQRVRIQGNFIVSEELQGVLMFEMGKYEFGRGGATLDADGHSSQGVKVKRAYLDWIIPHTEVSVRMGIQGVTLPSGTGFGNPVWEADTAGVVISSPVTDWLSATVFWLRPFNAYTNDPDRIDSGGWTESHWDDEVDVFGFILPMSWDGISVTPWAAYAMIGGNSGIFDYMFEGGQSTDWARGGTPFISNNYRDDTWAIYAGVAAEFTLWDPLTFGFDVIYGYMDDIRIGSGQLFNGADDYFTHTDRRGREYSTWSAEGWLIDARLDYKFDWGTPGIFGWWGSGDDSNALRKGELGRIPAFANDGGNFLPTTFGFSGTYGIAEDTVVSGTGAGTWGIGLQIADVSFIEDLSHTLRVAYYQGTNSSKVVKELHRNGLRGDTLTYSCNAPMYLTDKDNVIEVNFDHTYQIYENLTAVLELGYLHLDADKGVWKSYGQNDGPGNDSKDNAWKAQLMFQYKF